MKAFGIVSFYIAGMWAAWCLRTGDPVDLVVSLMWAVTGGILVGCSGSSEGK